MSQQRSRKAASSFLFKLMESLGAQIIALVVKIILARILLPEDYGVLAMLLVFTAIAQTFVQSGLNTALIQRQDIDETDRSTVFYFSLGMAALLYAILFFSAPWLSKLCKMPGLDKYLRVLALMLFPGAALSVQNAHVARQMEFRKLMLATLVSTLLSGVIGIIMAYSGFGIWALVWQQLSAQLILSLILFFVVKWRPRWLFSIRRAGNLFRFSWKLLVSSLMDTGYRKLRSFVIGREFDSEALAYYEQGALYPELMMNAVNGSIQSVMLPVLSEQQNEPDRLKQTMRRSVMVSSFLVLPMMAGLAAVAKPLVLLLLTDKWLPCVPFLQICCIDFAFYPIHTANLQAINAMGRSDVFLRLEVIKKAYGIGILLITVFCFNGVLPIAWGAVVSTVLSSFVNAWPNKKLIGYGYLEQIRDILPPVGMALVMFLLVSLLGLVPLSPLPLLAVQVAAGVAVYALLSLLFRPEAFRYLVEAVKSFIAKRKEQTP
ncbi:MAG: lipopolysaccharide biosynthesis protein [Clostridiales bacterium]|nr:lipopolysaccharide biosynthesis protein [Clostridiales bacterium]